MYYLIIFFTLNAFTAEIKLVRPKTPIPSTLQYPDHQSNIKTAKILRKEYAVSYINDYAKLFSATNNIPIQFTPFKSLIMPTQEIIDSSVNIDELLLNKEPIRLQKRLDSVAQFFESSGQLEVVRKLIDLEKKIIDARSENQQQLNLLIKKSELTASTATSKNTSSIQNIVFLLIALNIGLVIFIIVKFK